MSTRKPTKKAAIKKANPDVHALAEQFSQALAMIEVAIMSLEAADGRGYPELIVFEYGVKGLKAVYTKLDRIST